MISIITFFAIIHSFFPLSPLPSFTHSTHSTHSQLLTLSHSSATNRLITAKDHASVQIHFAEVDAEGRATGTTVPFALSGAVRFAAEADNSLCRLATEQGLLKSVWSAQH